MRRLLVPLVAGVLAIAAGPVLQAEARDGTSGLIDTTPPYVIAVHQGIGDDHLHTRADGSLSISMGISFTLGDVDDQVGSWEAEQSRDGGPFQPLFSGNTGNCDRTGDSPAETTFNMDATRVIDHAYQIRIRATDCAGNTGDWRTAKTRSLSSVQEDAFAYTGQWAPASDPDAWEGGVMRTSEPYASASYTFHGTSLGLVTTLGPGYGAARMYVKGKYWMIPNGHTTKTTHLFVKRRGYGVNGGPLGTYTVTVVAFAPPNHPLFDVDGLVVWG